MRVINAAGAISIGVILGFVSGTLLCKDEPTDRQIYEGYRLCMQSASVARCHMTPDDFVVYWRVKENLEKDVEIRN